MSLCNFKHILKGVSNIGGEGSHLTPPQEDFMNLGKKLERGFHPLSNIGRFLTSFEMTSRECRPRLTLKEVRSVLSLVTPNAVRGLLFLMEEGQNPPRTPPKN